jgi:hypothetical protein
VARPLLDVLAEPCARTAPPGVLLKRDEHFPPVDELADELESVGAGRVRPERRPEHRAGGGTTTVRAGPGRNGLISRVMWIIFFGV